MYDDNSPIESPHPGLKVDEVKNELSSYMPADNPVLLYRGPMIGQWRDTKAVYSCFQGLPNKHSLANQLLTGVEGMGEAALVLSPDPHISWHFGTNLWPLMAGWPELVPPSGISSEFATRAGADGPPNPFVSPNMNVGRSRVMFPVQIGNQNSRLDEIRFYLINFQVIVLVDDMHRKGKPDPKARLSLRANGWRIDIERRPDFNQALHYLEELRGYAVTHNCRIWRENDAKRQQFTFEDAEPVLEAVQLFVSFVRGGMVGVTLPVGYRDDISEFEKWHVTPVDPGRYPDPNRPRPFPGWYLWYDDPRANREASKWLPPLFNQFAAKWWHPDTELQKFWRKVFRELIYTYTDAERIDERRGIVPACIALETLGWAILVVMTRWLNGGRHNKLAAADIIRLLLGWAGITTEIPGTLKKLVREAKSGKFDGPQVITWVRNLVVHPDKKSQLTDEIAAQAWLLAMWYTELIVLKLLDYDGYYRDRLDDGKIKRVPWVDE